MKPWLIASPGCAKPNQGCEALMIHKGFPVTLNYMKTLLLQNYAEITEERAFCAIALITT
jgi:hypothetical protein